jgi:hypothetical protein
LTSFASVPLSTSSGPIQAVIYDGANTELSASGGTLPLTLSGFTVPAAPFGAKTTAVVADGQVAGNSFSFAGSGPAFTDPAAFPGTGPCPSGWSFGCLWDNNCDVTSTPVRPTARRGRLEGRNPGYSSNPGHAGTGTVVAQIC